MLRKNTASQFIHFAGVKASDGSALTGATFSYRRCIDGTFAAGGGTITEDTGLGFYKVALAQADTNGNDLGFFFTATSAVPVAINVITTAADPTDGVRLGLTALPNAAAAAAGGLIILGSNNTAAITIGALTTGAIACTTITASGAVAFQSTFAVTGTTTLTGAVSLGSTLGVTGTTTFAAVTTTGTMTLNALTVSNATTLTGAVSLGSTLSTTGTVTLNALTISNNLLVSGTATVTGATTLTGAITATNASNSITGVTINSNLKKNQALTGYTFPMANSSGALQTGLSDVTVYRSIDGGTFGVGTTANIAEVGSSGRYKVDFGAGDLNGKTIYCYATATGCVNREWQFITDA